MPPLCRWCENKNQDERNHAHAQQNERGRRRGEECNSFRRNLHFKLAYSAPIYDRYGLNILTMIVRVSEIRQHDHTTQHNIQRDTSVSIDLEARALVCVVVGW